MHAYKNPVHEQQAKALIEADFPQLPVCISSDVSPEIREYERTSTTVVNAYVLPLVDRYIRRIDAALIEEGFGGRFLLMLSSGTLAMPEVARRFPVRLLESGPVAGALIAGELGREAGRQDIVTFDMGGTTAKVCLVCSGRPNVTPMTEVARVHRFKPGSGLPVKTPVVDMIEIGAGGGSIAHVGPMGLLQVGPQSAGADPGPASYAFGGTEATVTDACVVLGYIDPGAFLGGSMRLDAGAARNAVTRAGAPLGLDSIQTAWGIFAIVCENMAQAARLYLIERGQDPRRFSLMGFGGAGPAAATRVAHLLAMAEVFIPPASGVASAVGLLMAPTGFDFGHSYAGELDDLDWIEVERLYSEMEAEGRRMVTRGGTRLEEVRIERRAEMRYARQFHDIEIPVPVPLPATAAAVLRTRFDAEYARLYGVTLQAYPVQALNWRVLVAAQAPRLDLQISPRDRNGESLKGRRPIYLPTEKRFVEVPVYDRYRLAAGATLQGPAVVEEAEATTLLWPGDHLIVDRRQNLVITIATPRI
jgi:5-oxoprolinase (ATP-hydrolysing)/N-methylhydantoinase A